jgi:integrating conjugative element protein (TIGR03765 family)
MKKLLVLLSIASMVSANDLPVIANNGVTVPSQNYLAVMPNINGAINSISPETLEKASQTPSEISLTTPLPTTSMTIGTVTNKQVNLPWLLQPVFLIGTDKSSTDWLQFHKTALIAMHANGMIVNANSESAIKNTQALGQGLVILPISADAIVERLSLTHYPVLITRTEVMQ